MRTEREGRKEHSPESTVPTEWADPEMGDESREALSDPYTKSALRYLVRVGRPVKLDELARGTVGLIEGIPKEEVEDKTARRVETWLHHGHLPELERYGFVDFDRETSNVRICDTDEVVM